MRKIEYKRRKGGFLLEASFPAPKNLLTLEVILNPSGATFSLCGHDEMSLAQKYFPASGILGRRFCPPFNGAIVSSAGLMSFEYSEADDSGLDVKPCGRSEIAHLLNAASSSRELQGAISGYLKLGDVPVVGLAPLRGWNLAKYFASGFSRYTYGYILNDEIFTQNRWLLIALGVAELFIKPHYSCDFPT